MNPPTSSGLPNQQHPVTGATDLTPEQRTFAHMLGQVLAERWAARQGENPSQSSSRHEPPVRAGDQP